MLFGGLELENAVSRHRCDHPYSPGECYSVLTLLFSPPEFPSHPTQGPKAPSRGPRVVLHGPRLIVFHDIIVMGINVNIYAKTTPLLIPI